MPSNLGQVFTPLPLAQTIVDLVPSGASRILDPTCGDGAFLLAASQRPSLDNAELLGVEVDDSVVGSLPEDVPRAFVKLGCVFSPEASTQVDVIVGNPPFVSHKECSNLRGAIVERLTDTAEPVFWEKTEIDRWVKRANLCDAVVLRCLQLLEPLGQAFLIVPLSTLETTSAATTWRLVERHASVSRVFHEDPGTRWFQEADVRCAVVELIRRPVVRPVVSTLLGDVFKCVAGREPRSWVSASVLRGARLLAEPARLGDYADVVAGIRTNNNGAFYVDAETAATLEPDATVPILRYQDAPASAAIRFAGEPTTRLVIYQDDAPRARAHVESRGGKWSTRLIPEGQLILSKSCHQTFGVKLLGQPYALDQRFYGVVPRDPKHVRFLASWLASAYGWLAMESVGRRSMGGGALDWAATDVLDIPVPRLPSPRERRPLYGALLSLEHVPTPAVSVETFTDPARVRLDDAWQRAVPGLLDRDTVTSLLLAAVTARTEKT